MPTIEVSIPDQVEGEITRLVESDEFVSREEAIESLLSMGISSYTDVSDTEADLGPETFSNVLEEQVDPAMRDEIDEGDYTP